MPHDDRQRMSIWAGTGCSGMMLTVVCLVGALLAFFIVPTTSWYANFVWNYTGTLEVIVPAQWSPGGGTLSPGGRYMQLSWERTATREPIVWDLETNIPYVQRVRASASCWLTDHTFLLYDPGEERYYVVQARGVVPMEAQVVGGRFVTPPPEEQAVIRARWKSAEQLYLIRGLGNSGNTVLTIEAGHPYIYLIGAGNDNNTLVEQLTAGISPIVFDRPSWTRPESQQIFASHDGRLQAQVQYDGQYHLRIFTPEGQVLAEVSKIGWYTDPIGWAADNSGVYFRMTNALHQPIFKLSVLTPEEARWQTVWRWLGWGGAATLVAAGAAWWRRRRRG